MAMYKDSAEATENAAPVVPNIAPAPGLSVNDPEAQARMQEAMKLSGRDYARVGLMGAAAGAQAGQGAMNPLSAFIQGAAMGLQAPAQIYNEKRKQIQSTIDATPFGVTHPEIAKDGPYKILAGLPTAIALEVIGGIAKDTAKVTAEGMEARKSEAAKNRITSESAPGYAALYQKATGKTIDPDTLIGLNESEIKDFIDAGGVDMSKVFANEKSLRDEFVGQVKAENFSTVRDQYFNLSDAAKKGTAPGDMKMIFSYMKMLDPNSIVRESEYATAQNAAGIPSRLVVAYNKALDGQSLSPQQRSEFLAEARDIWKRKTSTFKSTVDTYRTLAKNSGFDPNRVVTNIGNVLAYTDPNDSKYIAPEPVAEVPMQRKAGEVFSEAEGGWISTYKVVEKDGKLFKMRVSAVEDKE